MQNRMFVVRNGVVAALTLGVLLTGARAQDQRLITESDLLKFVWIADPQISPDGSQVAFTRVVVNDKQDDYATSLFVVPAGGNEPPRQLTSGTRDSSPRWAPDGRRLAFVRSIDRDGRAQPPQIYVLSFDGGEARAVTDLPRGASAPVWSPDGTRIAFSSATRPDDPATPAPPATDVRVITSAVYRANGGGWNDPERPSHLWVTDVTAGPDIAKARQLTSGKYSEAGAVWSADSARVFVVSTRVDEPYYAPNDSDVYAVPAAGGGRSARSRASTASIGNLEVSPDGKSLAFVGTLNGSPERSYSQSDLFVTSADGSGAPRNLTANYDFDINGGIGGDQAAPRGGSSRPPIWSQDGTSIVVVSGEQGDANLVRFDVASGKAAHLLKGPHAVQSYSATRDRGRLVALVSTQTQHRRSLRAGPARRTASRSRGSTIELFRNAEARATPEEIWWTSFDGKKIQGWLLHPPDFDKTKKYPFILEIHGGPHSAYGNIFTHEFQWMAAKGYVVLFPNPRGSSNYGQDFGNVIQYRYPGDDYKDLMAGVDMC